MPNNPPQRNQPEHWWSFRMTAKDMASAGFEERERGPEAAARHQAYVQNAYATLSPRRELFVRGLQAGLQVGAAALAVETAVLMAIIIAAITVSDGSFGSLYGATPVSGTFFEPLWPVMLSLPILPAFGLIGGLAALLRRVGNNRRRVLFKYFNPISPRLDFITFWLAVLGLLIAGACAIGAFSANIDPTGVLTLALCASGLLAWPCHRLWLFWYFPLIEKYSSVPIGKIRAIIERQL